MLQFIGTRAFLSSIAFQGRTIASCNLKRTSYNIATLSTLAVQESITPIQATADRASPGSLQLTSVTETDNAINLLWNDGRTTNFHYSWLHANCTCPQCVTSSGQRTLEHNANRRHVYPVTVQCEDDNLKVGWSHRDHTGQSHISSFSAEWLRHHSYDDETLILEDSGRSAMNDPMLQQIPRVNYEDVMNTKEGFFTWLNGISSHGLCIITNTPNVAGTVGEVATKVGPLSHTIYGDTFEVKAVPKPINVAYTDKSLPPHMDLAYFESPPGVQMLHCRQFDEAVQGGNSTFIDAHGVAEVLREQDPEAFENLVRIPATFQKDHADRATPVKMFYQRPHISVNSFGSVISVFWSPPFEGPLRVPGRDVELYYDAYAKFEALFEDESVWQRFGTRFRVNEGEILCFNNRRLLHGRDAFTSEQGVRHLEGCYLDIDMYLNKLRVLGVELGLEQSAFGCDESRAGVGTFR